MALTYHAGRRIQGTQADFDGTPAVSGGWKEIGRTSLGSAGDTISVGSLSDKRYYMVLQDLVQDTSNINSGYRLNGDSGSNYSFRRQQNGGADGTDINQASLTINGGGNYTAGIFAVGYWANLSSKEKLQIGHSVYGATGAASAPMRSESAGKWTNTSNPISTIAGYNSSGGNYATGSEVVVLGWDPDDTHTDNFWEELSSTTTSSAGDTLSSGTISAKKYLWVQATYKNNGAADINAGPRFNSDSGNNYSSRYSLNGGADTARTSRNKCDTESGSQEHKFCNMFIINNASNEKLVITHVVTNNGSGSGNAPQRWESVSKWANTSSQITQIDFDQLDAGDYAAGAELRVWGAN